MFQRKGSRHVKSEDRSKAPSRSVSLDTDLLQPAESRSQPEECLLAPSRECWMKKRPGQPSSFSGFSNSDSVLRELDDGQFDQEDGVTQVTCMWAKKESNRRSVNNYLSISQVTLLYYFICIYGILWIFPDSGFPLIYMNFGSTSQARKSNQHICKFRSMFHSFLN